MIINSIAHLRALKNIKAFDSTNAMSLQDLKNAPSEQIRAILIALCSDEQVRRKALDYYHQFNSVQGIGASTSYPGSLPSSDMKICVQCETVFDTNDNTRKHCRYHNGEFV